MSNEPIHLGSVSRFGSGTVTEIEFTQNVPSGSSVVGCLCLCGDLQEAVFWRRWPSLTPPEYWSATVGAGGPASLDGGSFPSTQPIYSENVYPDPSWVGYSPENPNVPYWFQIEDESGNFYGWDGITGTDSENENRRKRFDVLSVDFHGIGFSSIHPTQDHFFIWFSCHNVSAIEAGQKLVIKHPGYAKLNMVPIYWTGGEFGAYTTTPPFLGSPFTRQIYGEWEIKEGPINAAIWMIPGIKERPPNQKGIYSSLQDNYIFPETETFAPFDPPKFCNGNPFEGFFRGGGYPPFESGLPRCEPQEGMSEYEYYHLPDAGFAPEKSGVVMHAFVWGGGEGDTVNEGDARDSGLTQLIQIGTSSNSLISKPTSPSVFAPMRDFPLDRGLEVRFRRGRVSTDTFGNRHGADVDAGYYHWPYVGWKVPFAGGYWAPFNLDTNRNEVLTWKSIVLGSWVYYPLKSTGGNLDFDRMQLHGANLVTYISPENQALLDRLNDSETDAVEETIGLSDFGCTSVDIEAQSDGRVLILTLNGDNEVFYQYSDDEGRTWKVPKEITSGYSLATFAWGVVKPKELVFSFYDQASGFWKSQKGDLSNEGEITLTGSPVNMVEAAEVKGTLKQRNDGVWEFLYMQTEGDKWAFVRSDDGCRTWS